MGSVKPNGAQGISVEELMMLKVNVGILREIQRDNDRKNKAIEMKRILDKVREGLAEKLQVLVAVFENTSNPMLELENEPLAKRAKGLKPQQMDKLAETCEATIKTVEKDIERLRTQIAKLSDGVEDSFRKDIDAFIAEEAKMLRMKVGRMDGRLRRARNLSSRFREDAKKRRFQEIEHICAPARKLLKHNKKADAEVFESEVKEKDFLSFFESADKEVPLEEQPPVAEEGEAKPAAVEPKTESVVLSRKDAKRIFGLLLEAQGNKAASVPREVLLKRLGA